MNTKHNESYDSRMKNASHDQSRNSVMQGSEKGKYKDGGDEIDPKESLKEAFNFAKRLLVDGQPQQASDKCMKALKDANEIFGENSAETLPGYFILAEANIEEGKLKRAEDFLIAAYWNLLKHSQDEKQAAGNNTNANQKSEALDEKEYMMFKGTLHKVFAKLYTAKREYDRAMDEIKNGIYIDSCHYGPEDIQTSLSYFSLGQIFVKSGDPEKGYSFYNQAIKIWYKFFKIIMSDAYNQPEVDEIIIKQGLSLLKGAENLFLDRLRSEGEQEVLEDVYKLNYALAFMHKYLGEEDVSMEYCRNIEGYLIGRYGHEHSKLNRFYNFFPGYRENAPRDDEEFQNGNQSYGNQGYGNRGYANQDYENQEASGNQDEDENQESQSQESEENQETQEQEAGNLESQEQQSGNVESQEQQSGNVESQEQEQEQEQEAGNLESQEQQSGNVESQEQEQEQEQEKEQEQEVGNLENQEQQLGNQESQEQQAGNIESQEQQSGNLESQEQTSGNQETEGQ